MKPILYLFLFFICLFDQCASGMDTLKGWFSKSNTRPKSTVDAPMPSKPSIKPKNDTFPKSSKLEVEREPECVTCLTNTNEPLMSLDCDPRHRFHISCTSKWFKQRKSCPSCRKDAISLDESKILLWEKINSGRLNSPQIFSEIESMMLISRLQRVNLEDSHAKLNQEYKKTCQEKEKIEKNSLIMGEELMKEKKQSEAMRL